jgi:hypothetical protein
MERYRAIKYIKTTRSAEMLFCLPFFGFLFCLLAASKRKKRRKLSNFSYSFLPFIFVLQMGNSRFVVVFIFERV